MDVNQELIASAQVTVSWDWICPHCGKEESEMIYNIYTTTHTCADCGQTYKLEE